MNGRQSTDGLGVDVTETDVDNAIKNAAGLLTGAPQDVYAPAYRALVLKTGLPNSEYRELMRAQVIQQMFPRLQQKREHEGIAFGLGEALEVGSTIPFG